MMTVCTYPKEWDERKDFPLFFIEIHDWEEDGRITWTLFKRNIIIPADKYEKRLVFPEGSLGNVLLDNLREGHSYQLASGNLNQHKNAIAMDTEQFLRFMVDAMNFYAEKNRKEACKGKEV
jgi:hypothetical protein